MAAQQMLYKSLKQKNQQKFPSGARPKDSAPRDGMGPMMGAWLTQWIGFVRKISTGNSRFSQEAHGAFRLKFSQTNQSID
jgi:hypothetical protein